VQALRRNKSGKVFALPQSYRVERFEAADRMDVTTEISPSEAGTILTVDLEAIVGNWQTLQMVCGDAECGAVVKADAYGLGLNPVVKALYEAGCKTFFVAHPFEGRAVCAIAPLAAIYVLNGMRPNTAPLYADFNLIPCCAPCRRSRISGNIALFQSAERERAGCCLPRSAWRPASTSLALNLMISNMEATCRIFSMCG